MKRVAVFFLLLALSLTAAAQPVIKDVANAGSRIAGGLPNYGIAQGSVFVITGTGIGTDTLQQAAFPLPSTDGLGGVTVQVAVGDVVVNAVMVYVSAGEVAAILPSATPTGTGTVTLTNNGTAATAPVVVVEAAFGIFTQDRTGRGPALAFNLAEDGSPVLNTLMRPALVGQTITINGTGLGPITGDETQPGLTDIPSTAIQVWVGSQQATVVAAGRGSCCTGEDAAFPIPQGVSGWDVLQVTVPEGVDGCHVPVAVITGKVVSNFATIAVAAPGASCTDPGGFDAAVLGTLTGTVRTGSIDLSRVSMTLSEEGFSMSSSTDTGSATFAQSDLSNYQAIDPGTNVSAFGGCIVMTYKVGKDEVPVAALPALGLDAGEAITIEGPGGTKSLTMTSTGNYSPPNGSFGTSVSLPSIPGMPSIPGLPGGGTGFLDAGKFTAGGAGGTDVGAFTADLTIPKPITWDNQDAIPSVARADGVTVQWSGGDPAAFIHVVGTSAVTVNDVTYGGGFVCTEKVSAGAFTVPPFVTLSLPASDTGALAVQSAVSQPFTASGIDIGRFSSSVGVMKNLAYQ